MGSNLARPDREKRYVHVVELYRSSLIHMTSHINKKVAVLLTWIQLYNHSLFIGSLI